MNEKEYIVELRIRVEEEVFKQYGGDINRLVLETTEEVPFSFDIVDCRKVNI